MIKILSVWLTSIIFLSCSRQVNIDIEYISRNFRDNISKIDKVQYQVRNIIEFSSGKNWDNMGFVVMEKEEGDSIFGFSFYGIRNDINESTIYKDGIGFRIFGKEGKFRQEIGGLHLLGSPGGQMIYQHLFKLDTVYRTAEVTSTDSSYVIRYVFEDDLENRITDKWKLLELDRETFLPIRATTSLQPDFGDRQTIVYVFYNVKTNDEVDKNVQEFLSELNELELIEREVRKSSPLLNRALPNISLKNLQNENEMVDIQPDKLTLIDFWEVWCGWCIKSFPEVERIKSEYPDDLKVVGIVTRDMENARKLVAKKEITFLNLIGDNNLIKAFNVTSWPRYFLVDKEGIIRKEYFGFSDKIEKDIQGLIRE